MKKSFKKLLAAAVLALLLTAALLPTLSAARAETVEVKLPFSIELDHAIAGAEFEMLCPEGLVFTGIERSEALSRASLTPVVHKNGNTYFGFFTGGNDLLPEDGIFDVGYLIFEHSGTEALSITINEARLVELVDRDNTKRTVLTLSKNVEVPPDSGAAIVIGENDVPLNDLPFWKNKLLYIFIFSAGIIISATIIIFNKKKSAASAHVEGNISAPEELPSEKPNENPQTR